MHSALTGRVGLLLFFIIELCLRTGASVALADESERRFRIAVSCAAYALIRTGDYPETVKVYQERKPANDQVEQERARTGMLWTNRVHFARSLGSNLFEQAAGRHPTNSEMSDAVAKWVKLINDATSLQREAIHTNCKPLYDQGDVYCATELCVAKP